MNATDLETLRRLSITYGTAEVVRELLNVTQDACQRDYANKPEAIIHQYVPALQEAFAKMSMARLNRFSAGAAFLQTLKGEQDDPAA
jgi:hypothetical protein